MSVKGGPNTVTSGLVLELDAGNIKSYQSGSTTWYDKSGFANNGTLINGVGYTSSFNGSLVFDGTDDYVTGSNNISISQSQPFTLEFWGNLSSYTNLYPCLCQIKTDTTYSFIVLATQNSTYDGISFGSTDTWIKLRNAGNQLLTNTWYQIVISYNGSGAGTLSNYKMYINTQEQTLTTSGGFINLSQINNIGNIENASRGSDNWNGRITIFKLYNKALSPQEVLQNYNATKTRFGL
jgi:hypothetical protein